ncbi:spartin-like [Lingula anatina]|uniref:Spartin-like n=1 Tax=Lingula anatina TaxID=7574 RepID=A0A1S3J385_LINAN|nr:spartin-like [Lingula anatina]|eukprot:XP_013404319.1 spartin-like [Lingula anatina]
MECTPGRSRPPRPPPMAPQTTVALVQEKIKKVKRYHNEAFQQINKALTYDEQGQKDQALQLYTRGCQYLDRALSIQCDGTGDEFEDVKQLKQKMEKTKIQINSRIEALKEDEAVAMAIDDPPPSYQASMFGASQDEFEALGDSIMTNENGEPSLETNAEAVYSIPEGVQIYWITPQGYVSAPSYPAALHIFKFKEQEPQGASSIPRPEGFLKVGDWVYPLQPGRSPVLHARNGAYMFPDVLSAQEGSAVGLMLPPDLPTSERENFEGILHSLTALQEEPLPTERPEPPSEAPREPGIIEEDRTSAKISRGLVTAAEWVSWGLGKASEKGGELLKMGAVKMKEHLKPEEQQPNVDPRVQKGLVYARKGTGVAVKVSGFLVNKLGEATMLLGRQLAPHIKKHGTRLLPKELKASDQEGRSKIDNVLEVAGGGLKGLGTVYNGLEVAAKALGKSIATQTVDVVQHKYGEQVGSATEHSLYTAGHIVMTGYNVKEMGIKAIAKRAAKDTGKAVLEDYKTAKVAKENGTHTVTMSELKKPPRPPPPDGPK